MANIKTRDVTRGSIKTLDRAASSMHHLKEETIRSKVADISGRYDSDPSGSYAQDTIEHYAGDSAAYASRQGVELILRSRGDGNGAVIQGPENIQHSNLNAIDINEAENRTKSIERAFREEGIKTILGRQEKARMADAEVLRNTEARNLGERVINGNSKSGLGTLRGAIGKEAKKRISKPSGADRIMHSKKEYAIKRIISRNENRSKSIITLLRPGNGNARKSRTVSGFLKIMWENARRAAAYIGAGGASIAIILTLFVFFGIGVITFSNNSPDSGVPEDPEAIEYFIPDLAGSPTRQAIVKAAAREVGNVGGEKFWRWYGFSGHVHWCACFASYIAAECGCIKSGICPKAAIVGDWVSFYKKQHRWARGDYIPHSGDFIIFDWEGDGEPDHIGIVESCDGKTVYTIEGNSHDVCKRKTYARGSSLIYGYGCPNYSGT